MYADCAYAFDVGSPARAGYEGYVRWRTLRLLRTQERSGRRKVGKNVGGIEQDYAYLWKHCLQSHVFVVGNDDARARLRNPLRRAHNTNFKTCYGFLGAERINQMHGRRLVGDGMHFGGRGFCARRELFDHVQTTTSQPLRQKSRLSDMPLPVPFAKSFAIGSQSKPVS